MNRFFSKIIVVHTDMESQRNRLMKRDHLSESEARSRIEAQIPSSKKCELATEVINNSISMEATRIQVKQTCCKLGLDVDSSWRMHKILGALGMLLGAGYAALLLGSG